MPRANEISLPLRASIVTLKSPHCGKSSAAIHELTGVSVSQINRIYAKAIERGFEPNVIPLVILNDYLINTSRSSRPTKQTEETR